jgi:hypothetical protein
VYIDHVTYFNRTTTVTNLTRAYNTIRIPCPETRLFRVPFKWYKQWNYFNYRHITISLKGWTTNKLSVKWFKQCFDPKLKKHQKGEYQLLILNGHASYISTEVIKFYIENVTSIASMAKRSGDYGSYGSAVRGIA